MINNTKPYEKASIEDILNIEDSEKPEAYAIGMILGVFISLTKWGSEYRTTASSNPSLTQVREILDARDRDNEHFNEAINMYIDGRIKEVINFLNKDYDKSAIIHDDQLVPVKNLNNFMGGLILKVRLYSKLNRAENNKEEIIAPDSESKHFLKLGDKIKGLSAIFVKSYDIQGYSFGYNSSGIYRVLIFKNEDGDIIVWKTSSNIEIPEEGDYVFFSSGTVKSHTVFRGVNQTNITRAKFDIIE